MHSPSHIVSPTNPPDLHKDFVLKMTVNFVETDNIRLAKRNDISNSAKVDFFIRSPAMMNIKGHCLDLQSVHPFPLQLYKIVFEVRFISYTSLIFPLIFTYFLYKINQNNLL